MKPIFPKWVNSLVPVIFLTKAIGAAACVFIVWYWFSPKHTDVGYQPDQPIDYSHKKHVEELGLDCRYCHMNVEKSPHATVPPTQVCMNCHNDNIKKDSPQIQKLMKAHKADKPIEWIRIHKTPDYAYFDHSAHVNAGVGCESCHGRVDQMVKVRQVKPLSMGWCLECHRNPTPNLRPKHRITTMGYPRNDIEKAEQKAFWDSLKDKKVNPPQECSACHR